jgi:hypothetical protein
VLIVDDEMDFRTIVKRLIDRGQVDVIVDPKPDLMDKRF